MNDRLLTTREVAAFLGLSPESVLRRYRRNDLPGYRLASNVLRFRESEIEAWLHRRAGVPLDRDIIRGYIPGNTTREERKRNEASDVEAGSTHG